jgi:hypothetical protein
MRKLICLLAMLLILTTKAEASPTQVQLTSAFCGEFEPYIDGCVVEFYEINKPENKHVVFYSSDYIIPGLENVSLDDNLSDREDITCSVNLNLFLDFDLREEFDVEVLDWIHFHFRGEAHYGSSYSRFDCPSLNI